MADTIVNVTVREDDNLGAPMPMVSVDVRTSLGSFIDRVFTNNSGLAVFALAPGSYLVYLTRIGVPVTFTRPISLVVGATSPQAVEYYGVPFQPIEPSGPGFALVYDFLYNLGMDPRPGIEVTAKAIEPSKVYLTNGPVLTGVEHTRTNAVGLFQFSLPRQLDLATPDVRYAIEIPRVNFRQEFDAADLDVGGAIILSSLS